jgi:two-component sensor histidine kinase
VLSVVQCFVTNTEADTAHSVEARIDSLSDVYDLIENRKRHRNSLASLLEQTLRPYATSTCDRIVLAGSNIPVERRFALALHLVFHELATNACKHRALASSTGFVEAHWHILAERDRPALVIQWRERSGPRVTNPQREGFGMRLIAKALPEAQIDIDFASSGLVVHFMLEAESWSLE